MARKQVTMDRNYAHQDIEIKSLGAFFDMAMGAPDCQIYRGVSKSSYELVPKLGRNLMEAVNLQALYDFEKDAFERFTRESKPYLTYSPQSNLEWMVLGQHYGLHTRLLDWTSNILVALYFACAEDPEESGAVYNFTHGTAYSLLDHATDPFELDTFKVVYPHHLDKRIVTQKGLFTIHPNPTEEPPWRCVKYIIGPKLKAKIKAKLFRMGITRSFIFQDLESLASDAMHSAAGCKLGAKQRQPLSSW